MIGLVAVVFWSGYSMASWGWCLIEGYDVPLTAWINPLHPYTWPAGGNPGYVRKGQIFPGGSPGTASTTTSSSASSGTATGKKKAPIVANPGNPIS
jgi:hypothetical protein